MKTEIKYIELKQLGHNHRGEAWIANVKISRSGRTIYFNDKALKRLNTKGYISNYYDLESDDEYWISGVKKNGLDRHMFGAGKIKVQKEIADEYLKMVEFEILDPVNFELVEIKETDIQRLSKVENRKLD